MSDEEPDFAITSFGGDPDDADDFGGVVDFPRPPVAINIDWNDSPEAADLIVTAESEELSLAIVAGIGVADDDVGVGTGGSTTLGISNSRYKLDWRNRK